MAALSFSLPYFFRVYFHAIMFSNFNLSIKYLNVWNMKYLTCNTVFSSASSTMSSTYFTVRITCPPILKSPKRLRTSLVRYSLYALSGIGDKHYSYLTILQIWTFLVTPWPTFIFNTLISLLFADQFSFAPDDTNPFGSSLILSSLHGQMPSASLWSKHAIFHLLL